MFSAAWPRSNMTESGASAPCRVGRHERDPDGRPGEVAGPRPDRRKLAQVGPVAADDERPALRVLRAAGAPAGVEDPLEMGGLERSVGEAPDRPPMRDRLPDGIVARSSVEPPAPSADDRDQPRAGAGRVAPGRATWASVRKPPGVVLDRREPTPRRPGSARPASRRRSSPASSGVQRSAERPGEEAARPPAGRPGYSYSQECWPPGTTSVSTGAASGSPRRAAARAAAARRARWPSGTTVSSVAVGEQDGPAIAGDRVALR